MKTTQSGEYKLPGPLKCLIGNLVIFAARFAPEAIRNRYLCRPTYYQVLDGNDVGDYQGLSINKWKAMRMPADLSGKSVLDIGCADGFFCRLCAKNGGHVTGIDSALGRLLRARFMALDENLHVDFRMDIFPSPKLDEMFDYVLCLSVLHHSLSKKDLWKTLIDDRYKEDLITLRRNLKVLKSLTADGGKCVIEMPYEYDDPAERKFVDFDRFNKELLRAGFRNAACLGDWEYNEKHRLIKDRIIYVAEA